ncbi:MAG: ribbon-helix-helix domain-containing protein [Sneathiella sp.]|nr:ribbon-helix-helix domain-containing protein [Sneathiella sp.]
MSDEIVKHSVNISGHRTSVSIEREFWDLFAEAAAARDLSLNQLITRIDAKRTGNLSSAIRLFVLREVTGASQDI